MHPKYFGDSYDIVKRSLIEWLRPLGTWHIQPLFTEGLSTEAAQEFARFLGGELVHPYFARTLKEHQNALLATDGVGNLFLDPDTGIGSTRKKSHVIYEDIERACRSNAGKIVMVYDQAFSRGCDQGEKIGCKIGQLSQLGIHSFAFCSHASFLFSSTSEHSLLSAFDLLVNAGLPKKRLIS